MTVVACLGFYVCYYLVDEPVMATYALFAVVAMGVMSQIAGPGAHRSLVLLRSLPVALVLVAAGTLVAGNVWAATAGVLAFGFVIAYSAAGGPLLAGLATGLQLFFVLACFPPYAPDTLTARVIGVCVGMGLLALAEVTLWPNRRAVSYAALLANASEGLAGHLEAHATGDLDASAAALTGPDWPAEGMWPSSLPPMDRPASAGRRDRALSDAGSVLSFTLARLREMPAGTVPPPTVAAMLKTSARTAEATAQALRGGPPPDADELADTLMAVRRSRGERSGSGDPDDTLMTTKSIATAAGVWTMAAAVRIALGAPVESGGGDRPVSRQRFPYADASTVGLWWQRFAVHLTPRSVYFQGAVRVALALAAARLVAGFLDLSHGFWVLLATLMLLRSRAADTRSALRPALLGTVVGAAAVGMLLVAVGARPDIYAAITPPIMVLALAAGALFGPVWGQALFTVFVALVFTQLAPAGAEIAGVRVVDVFVGAATGIAAGLLAWPRGAAGELSRSAARFLAAGGESVQATAALLTAPRSLPPQTDTSAAAILNAGEAMMLADAAHSMYQNEGHKPAESTVDWQAVITAGHHIVRGSELLRDTYDQGSLVRWRSWTTNSATNLQEACGVLANALCEGREPRIAPVALEPAPDVQVVDVQAWFAGVADDLTRLTSAGA